MWMWLCVLFGTAVLAAALWGGMKLFGHLAMQREEAERLRLQEEWKRRAAERKARAEGRLPGDPEPEAEEPPVV